MGMIRLLLALAVVFGHAPGWQQIPANAFNPIRPLAPFFAVQAFFVISGFYMEMIRSRYEPAGLWIFWSNRYSRLIASYLVVVLITVALAIALPGRIPNAPLDFINLSIFGTDISAFVGGSLLIPQSWSLGIELWFYALVPLFWRMPARYILAVIAASCAIRLGIAFSSLPEFPWQQRFFPSELAFFLAGMLSFRLRAYLTIPMALPIVVLGILFSGWLPSSTAFSASMAVLLFLTLPSIWEASSANNFDRSIGELSYPVYLVHITVGYFAPWAQSMWGGGMLMLLSVAAAIPLYLFVDRPLDSWRERRLNRKSVHDAEAMDFPGVEPNRRAAVTPNHRI